jgi:hypothetical protein
LPPEATSRFGLQPGARVRLENGVNHLRLHRPVTHLAKVYVEPTDPCNLTCSICIRNAWEVPLGRVSQATFDRILESPWLPWAQGII